MEKRTLVLVLLYLLTPFSVFGQSYYHLFPQFADGKFSDGSFYRSSLLVMSDSTTRTTQCTFTMRGLGAQRLTTRDGGVLVPDQNRQLFSIKALGYQVLQSAGTAAIGSGYSDLDCDGYVWAQVLYAYYSSSGVKISEAAVFAWQQGYGFRRSVLILDQREGARLGLALANVYNHSNDYDIVVRSVSGNLVGTARVTVLPKSSTAKFVHELVPGIPEGFVGKVIIVARGDEAYITALRFTGAAFTTIPVSACSDTDVVCTSPEPAVP
jgi:hypothetical protein